MTKKILSFMLAFCLIIPAMMFVGCKEKEEDFKPYYANVVAGIEFKALLQNYYVEKGSVEGVYFIDFDFSARNTLNHDIIINDGLLTVEASKVPYSNTLEFGPYLSEEEATLKPGEILSYRIETRFIYTNKQELIDSIFTCKYNGEVFAKFKIDANKMS